MNSKQKQIPDQIRILITGGTFDKEYNEITGNLYFKDTHVHEILALGRSQVPVAIRTLMLVDSLDLTDSDREIILDQCLKSPEKRIVITHGTDTMVDTARFLGPRITDRTIVLTGAMVPYTFGSSDGLFNLGSALAFAQTLNFGVYIAMNGHSFTWDNVIKNRQLGRFEQLT
jgi:L-asparaginase